MSEQSTAFLHSFKSQREEISGSLGPNANVKELMQRVVRMRKDLVDATPFLAPYDQRQCDSQLKTLDQQIQSVRESVTPKSRFAFKRVKPAANKESSPTDGPSLSETTPVTENNAPSTSPTSQLSISRRSNEVLSLHSIDNRDEGLPAFSSLFIAQLDSCVVNLLPSPSSTPEADATSDKSSFQITALHVRSLKNTILLAPVIPGSVLVHDCDNCIIAVGCHQVASVASRDLFRMHTSKNTDLHIYLTSRPVIEHSSALRFAPYPTSLSQPTEDGQTGSQHYAVQDFDWIKPTPSPNWKKLGDMESDALNKAPAGAAFDDALEKAGSGEERLKALRTLLPVKS